MSHVGHLCIPTTSTISVWRHGGATDGRGPRPIAVTHGVRDPRLPARTQASVADPPGYSNNGLKSVCPSTFEM
uniref:Uncharacterized protein n=1 Tax=Mycena chlorophos TaxID=658473 RepID=A0ABQ0M5F4_MYCCL|nr:predicted protein [Mycena chlorophos]